MNNCIFCKLIAGEIPSIKLMETDQVLAFMDIGPLVKGHALVIPKQHMEQLADAPQTVLHEIMDAVQQVARAMARALKTDGINIHQANGAAAGQVVPHLHFHVIPRFEHDGHHWNWTPKSYDRPEEAQQLAERIRKELAD